MKTNTTKKEQKAFSRRFSFSDWSYISSKMEFLDALDRSLEEAEVVARRLLDAQGTVRADY